MMYRDGEVSRLVVNSTILKAVSYVFSHDK